MNKFLFIQTLKRFSLAVILAVCAMTGAFAQDTDGITLKMENAPLGKVMDAIENQSQYLFLNDGVDVYDCRRECHQGDYFRYFGRGLCR